MLSIPQPSASTPALAFAGEGLTELTLDRDEAMLDFGGDAANAATMCACLGGSARLIGRVGSDPLGRRLLAFWRERGVDISSLVVDRVAPTGLYVNEVPDRSKQTREFTYWRHGSAGSRWSPNDIADTALLSGVSALVVTGITVSVSDPCAAAVWELVERARALSIPVVCLLNFRLRLDPDREQLARLATAADVLIASVEDLALTFPTWSPVEVFELQQESRHELVLTAGPVGATVSWSEGSVRQPAPVVPVRDTVGAGDALAGAYVWARFVAGHSPVESLAWGVAAASLSVQRIGCASSYPNAEDTVHARAGLPPAEPSQARDAVAG